MTRREIVYPCVGLAAGMAAGLSSSFAQTSDTPPARLASGVFAWESFPVEKTANGERRAIFNSVTATVDRRDAGDTRASYFVLRWTSPGHEGPKPGGSK